ncbi:TetR/AcrR family transcriptional regulator [Dactylosporangium darangshiense]|uniref:TetR/AcrR family transcriptional regulator n=1 Tax=Dactylosporangium darangshiense TaxID=579108 RepID=A0ABP8D907_9ACTN
MMDRLSRAEAQQRTRARVLAAARDEFTERGYRDAKVDAIAERAGLTRGGVYSNFPGKRALYFAVLAEEAARPPAASPPSPGRTAHEALGHFARGWLARLPLYTETDPSPGRLAVDLVPEILADEHTRLPYAQLLSLDAVLLGLALEQLHPMAGRRVGVAGAVLTHLQGAARLAAAAPGFVDEFAVVEACSRLAGLDLADKWDPPHLVHAPSPRPVDEPWSPPAGPVVDAVRDAPLGWPPSGLVAVLGLRRAAAIEEAVRAAAPGTPVTAVLVTGDPDELANLARLVLAELLTCLRPAFPESAWPHLRLVHDRDLSLATAAGVDVVSDSTETAVVIRDGRIVARADGFGACHAAASVT